MLYAKLRFQAKQFFALGGKTLHWDAVSPRLHPADLRNQQSP
ncbi:hypothetical protein [Ammoniphilus sp. 3BR4]